MRISLIFSITMWAVLIGEASLLAQISLIPKPLGVELKGGWVCIDIDELEKRTVPSNLLYVQDYLVKNLPKPPKQFNPVRISMLIEGSLERESYRIECDSSSVKLIGGDEAGLFYAAVSLVQLAAPEYGQRLPSIVVSDKARFSWRGMHLDCSRHFFSTEDIKRFLDLMALYKLNVFHWHLTDDQGWRIEIKRYPNLTKAGSYRSETLIGRPSRSMSFDALPHSGFYTQEEIKDIVEYASKLFITVVPEIEMPGHSLAALAAYPEFSCTGGPFDPARYWGVFEDVYCAGNDSVFQFIENILTEIMELFPGKYIHIGGDETPITRWQNCDKCKSRMKDENFADFVELHAYFLKRITKFLKKNEREPIGWDEVLDGGIANNITVMSWRGTEGGVKAVKLGSKVIMSPNKPYYFDHYQARPTAYEPLAIGGLNQVQDVYNFEPMPEGLNENEQALILGAQGNIWTEYICTFNQLTYMAIPRMLALSETLWSSADQKNYADFVDRFRINKVLLEERRIHFAKHVLSKN